MVRVLSVALLGVLASAAVAGCGGGGSAGSGGAEPSAPASSSSDPLAVAASVLSCLQDHGATTVKPTDGGLGGLATFKGDQPAWNADGGYASFSFSVTTDENGDPVAVAGFASQHVGTAAGAALEACKPQA